MPNIWTLHDEDSEDLDKNEQNVAVDEDEIEKPSFLRRLRKKKRNDTNRDNLID